MSATMQKGDHGWFLSTRKSTVRAGVLVGKKVSAIDKDPVREYNFRGRSTYEIDPHFSFGSLGPMVKWKDRWLKTKTKVIILANHNGGTQSNELIRSRTCCWRQARENACEQITIGFGLTSDWLRKWREYFWLSKANANYSRQSTENCKIIKWSSKLCNF